MDGDFIFIQWAYEVKPQASPLLVKEEKALYQGYKALQEAINN